MSLSAQKRSSHARCSSRMASWPSSMARSSVRWQRSASSSAGHAGRRVVGDELDDAQRLAGLQPPADDRLGLVGADRRLDRERRRAVDEVAVGAGHRHPAVGAAVAQRDLAVLLGGQARHQHAVVERAHLARVDAVPERRRGDVVLVLAVLAVEELRRHDDRRVALEQRDLEREHGEVAVGQADEPLRAHPHPLAGRRAPHQVPRQRAVAEVEHPLVGLDVGAGQQQRLVVDVQLHQLGVGHVDDRLARLGEPERLLGVVDVPRLVEPVEERAVAVGVAPLLRVGPHADVPVGDGEERLGQAEVARRRTPARRGATGSIG